MTFACTDPQEDFQATIRPGFWKGAHSDMRHCACLRSYSYSISNSFAHRFTASSRCCTVLEFHVTFTLAWVFLRSEPAITPRNILPLTKLVSATASFATTHAVWRTLYCSEVNQGLCVLTRCSGRFLFFQTSALWETHHQSDCKRKTKCSQSFPQCGHLLLGFISLYL